MTKLLPLLIIVISSFMPISAFTAQPVWCSKTDLLDTEITICNNKTLSKADSLLDQMYRAVLSFRGLEGMWPDEVTSNQRDWFEQRNTLSEKSDILDAYTTRIKALTQMLIVRLQP
ncbi:MAG: hypothetical protein ACI8VW_002301 [bacterium]|jgi:uncharacterized protein